MAYKSSYTGPQIDQAVGNALLKDTSTLSNDVNHIPASSVVKSALTHDIANIVATGSTNTTGAIISSGTYFYLDGALVQAIGSGISTGAPFTLNTNYKVVTAGGLNDLKAAIPNIVYDQFTTPEAVTINPGTFHVFEYEPAIVTTHRPMCAWIEPGNDAPTSYMLVFISYFNLKYRLNVYNTSSTARTVPAGKKIYVYLMK